MNVLNIIGKEGSCQLVFSQKRLRKLTTVRLRILLKIRIIINDEKSNLTLSSEKLIENRLNINYAFNFLDRRFHNQFSCFN